jgi:hypothetical protein
VYRKNILTALLYGVFFLLICSGAGRAETQGRLTISLEGGGLYLTNPGWLTAARDSDREQSGLYMGSSLNVVEENYGFSRLVPGGLLSIAYRMSPSFALELGAGYFRRSWTLGGRYSSGTHPVDPSLYQTDYRFRMRTYPFTVGGRYVVYENARTALSMAAGVGVYILRMDYRKDSENAFTSSWTGSYVQFLEREISNGARRTDIGAYLSLREEIFLSSRLAVFAEAGAQIAPLGKIRGATQAESRQYVDGELIYTLTETRSLTWIDGAGASLSGFRILAGFRLRLK